MILGNVPKVGERWRVMAWHGYDPFEGWWIEGIVTAYNPDKPWDQLRMRIKDIHPADNGVVYNNWAHTYGFSLEDRDAYCVEAWFEVCAVEETA